MFCADLFSEFSGSMVSVWRFVVDGGVFMLCLLTLSLLSVAVIIFKAITLRSESVVPESVQDAIGNAEQYVDGNNVIRLAECLRAHPSPLSRIGLGVIIGGSAERAETSSVAEARAREEIVSLERGIALLEVVITIAPLLGLLGTVSGLVGVFGSVDMGGAGSARVEVSKGIAEALNTTIAGLAVAVPTVIAHSYFTKKLERMGVRMEVLTGLLISAVYRHSSQVIDSMSNKLVSEQEELPPKD